MVQKLVDFNVKQDFKETLNSACLATTSASYIFGLVSITFPDIFFSICTHNAIQKKNIYITNI